MKDSSVMTIGEARREIRKAWRVFSMTRLQPDSSAGKVRVSKAAALRSLQYYDSARQVHAEAMDLDGERTILFLGVSS